MNAESRRPEVLVIDDEVQIRRLLRVTLEAAGYAVRDADAGQFALNEIAFRRPDVVILDLGLPDLPGVEVLRRLREWSQVPVLILSVREAEADKIAALDMGADDYLTKPFAAGELLARLRVVLRHTRAVDEPGTACFGSIEVDFARRTVTRNGAEVRLTAKEYALLCLLLRHRGKVITHRQVLREIWGPMAGDQTHYLRVYVARLRQKLEDEPNRPRFIRTEAGVGYRFSGE